MRALHEAKSAEAAEAIELFIWRAARECGAMAASLGGVDAIVFTAGIGENHAGIRREICERLQWLGIRLDQEANDRHRLEISSKDSPIRVFVVPTNEELMIARHTADLLAT
jgi:acetate kinase